MNDYNSINHGGSHELEDNNNDNAERPHLYSTPAVSAPLITWFGLPTIIEFEQPATTTAAVAAALEEEHEEAIAEEEESEFKSIKGEAPHVRSYSQPAYSISKACKDHQQLRQLQQAQQRRARSKSLFLGGGDSTSSGVAGDITQPISAYTYRVRTIDSSDEHRLRLRQNLDGTYSYVDGEQLSTPDIDDNVPDSESGVLMMSQYRQSENLKASVSLDTVMSLEMTLADMENKALPPHVHPSIPSEILNPEFTRTAPPLKLWPLAVLVFYSK